MTRRLTGILVMVNFIGWACGGVPQAARVGGSEGRTILYVNGTTGDDTWDGGAPDWNGSSGPKRTLRGGIDACPDSGSIRVADGVYSGTGNVDVTIPQRPLSIQSENGPAACVFDAQGSGRILHFIASSAATVVTGFTLTGGACSDVGGAIYCEAASPRLVNLRVVGNTSAGWGAGLGCTGDSNPVAVGCRFERNVAAQGGAVACSENASITMARTALCDNSATNWGGAVACLHGTAALENCYLADNVSGGWGGALCAVNQGSILVTGCTLTRNRANYGGGAMAVGAGIQLANAILWSDEASTGPEIDLGVGGTALVSYSDVQGGEDGVWVSPGAALHWGRGNLDVDPRLLADGSLQDDSPCIDAGDPGFVPRPGEPDLNGNARVWDGDGDGTALLDMGAYEFGSHPYGDLNCDGAVDSLDIDGFILVLFGSWNQYQEYYVRYPGCTHLLADFTGDALVNSQDINGFVETLFGQ